MKFNKMFVFPEFFFPIIKAFLGWLKQNMLFVIASNFFPIISSKYISYIFKPF